MTPREHGDILPVIFRRAIDHDFGSAELRQKLHHLIADRIEPSVLEVIVSVEQHGELLPLFGEVFDPPTDGGETVQTRG